MEQYDENKLLAVAILSLSMTCLAYGQNTKVFTASDYDRAASMLSGNTSKLIDNSIRPQWLPDGSLMVPILYAGYIGVQALSSGEWQNAHRSIAKELFEQAGVEPPGSNRRSMESISPDGKSAVFYATGIYG